MAHSAPKKLSPEGEKGSSKWAGNNSSWLGNEWEFPVFYWRHWQAFILIQISKMLWITLS